MLDRAAIKKINEFVYSKPRTIQEISILLGKNWRTADRYVMKISEETGSISCRTFRKGTRGALKIVFWNNIEKIHASELHEKLFNMMQTGKKTDFSPFDIYQHIDDEKRRAVVYDLKKERSKDRIKEQLKSSEEEILSFSGDLSWVNVNERGEKLIDVLRKIAENNISIKIISRVTVDTMKDVSKVLALNDEIGKKIIEIRHAAQPLRGIVVDRKLARFREVIDHIHNETGKLDQKILLFYEIYDEEWIEWLQKIFWHIFRTALPAEKRIKDINSIMNVYKV